jgi:hypothetical protein
MTATTLHTILLGILVGIASTATMDVFGTLARKAGLIVGAKGIWVGRWYLGMTRGQFAHADIAEVPEMPREGRAALLGHYLIGIVLAMIYAVGAGWLGISPASPVAAIGFGLATCIFPFFLVYPCLGFGAFGLKGPSELRLLRTSVLNHLFYGVGLWWFSWLFRLG